MAKAEVFAGICGFKTTVIAQMADETCMLTIESDCAHIERLAENLKSVDPFQEISHRGDGPQSLRLAAQHCPHPACPVPAGIVKAIEVAAGLALPADATIKITR
ncbi:hypothetical protein JXJ21_18990 [candidate division KSB1 bacterium]|nr:hypothetical protein [candidate division KSB1 bacterium]